MNNQLNRRHFIGSTAATLMALSSRPAWAADTAPNVLFINTDQQRKDTLGCYGNARVQTPHLDGLAERGALFQSCYVTQPVCSPCRSSMVTGLFPNATTVVENNIPLPSNLFTWPRALREGGYKTAYIGKWHLGVEPVPDYFDLWRGYHTGWGHFIDEEPSYPAPGQSDSAFRKALSDAPPILPEDESLIGKYRPDVETDYALDFIRGNQDRPFACWLSFYPPHTEKVAPEENIALYRGRIQPEDQAVYHAMVNRLDWNIGRILALLDELTLRERTLIIFTSDHGENFPLRWNDHYKRLCYDQSANVPLLMSLPGTIPEGEQIDSVVSIADLCPTILELCGMKVPAGLHGDTMKSLLSGDTSKWRDDALIQNLPYKGSGKTGSGEKQSPGQDPNMRERCMVTAKWKLILNTSRPPELYNRNAPEPDRQNLYGQPETVTVVREMAARMTEWATKTGDRTTTALVGQWISD